MNNERFNKIVAELKFAGEYAAICGGAYMLGGADMALAFVRKTPAPLVGAVVGGPVGLIAGAAALGGYVAFKHYRARR